jgi:hypothetical protein
MQGQANAYWPTRLTLLRAPALKLRTGSATPHEPECQYYLTGCRGGDKSGPANAGMVKRRGQARFTFNSYRSAL